jgi:hypothetical protein
MMRRYATLTLNATTTAACIAGTWLVWGYANEVQGIARTVFAVMCVVLASLSVQSILWLVDAARRDA